jgi:hypothetical protein
VKVDVWLVIGIKGRQENCYIQRYTVRYPIGYPRLGTIGKGNKQQVIGGVVCCSLKRIVELCPVKELHTHSTVDIDMQDIVRAGRIDTSAKWHGCLRTTIKSPTGREWRLVVERRCLGLFEGCVITSSIPS